MNFKESQLLTEFPFVSAISNFLSAQNQIFFHLKYPFCFPLDSVAQNGNTTHLTLAMPRKEFFFVP